MEIKIESPHFIVSQQLNDYILAKVGKLGHINERLISCEIDKSSTDDNKTCEIKVFGPRIDLFASQHSTTFEDAITETLHALEKQLRKEKTKREKDKEKIEMEDPSTEKFEE